MFSNNRRISDRQLQALLLADWIGKMVLLLPGLAGGYSGLDLFTGTVLGLLLAAGGLLLILRGAWSAPVDYYTYVKKQEGRAAAGILYLVYGVYFLAQTVLLLFLCGEIASVYLLPEYTRPVLMVLPLVVGYFLARGGLEIRGRVSEMLAWVLAAVLLAMLLLAAVQIEPARLWEAVQPAENSLGGTGQPLRMDLSGIFWCVGLTASGFGSILTIPLVLPETEQRKGWKKKLYLAFCMAGIFLLLVYLCGYGIFGAAGMKRLSWPMITLMTSIDFHGIFFQRWDVFLTALLLVSLFLSTGNGIYYMERIVLTLREQQRNRKRGRQTTEAGDLTGVNSGGGSVRIGCAVLAYLLAWGAGSWERIRFFYERVAIWFCVPVLALFVLLVKRKRRTKAVAGVLALLTVAAFLLTGCGARELESRRFPLVLELDAKKGELILGCAWPTVKENGGKQSQEDGMGGGEKSPEAQAGSEQDAASENTDKQGVELVNDERITRAAGAGMAEAVKNVQSLQDRYVDYSQVKAILWRSGLKENPQLEREVLLWLEENPAISGNILVFRGKTQDLSLEIIQEHAQGQPGDYLENLYRNNEEFQNYTCTLNDLLYP